MNCDYCGSEYHDADYHPGTCANCGGPKEKTVKKYFLENDMYGDCMVYDEVGRYVRMATDEDKKTLGWRGGMVKREGAEKPVYTITNTLSLTEDEKKRISEVARNVLKDCLQYI